MFVGFTGEYKQKVDGKGRMSIPAEFRRVLEEGDPTAKADGRQPAAYINFGEHLHGRRLVAMTAKAFAEIGERIMSVTPRTDEEQEDWDDAVHLMLTQTIRLDVDRDGRVVLPIALREKMGMTEGEVVFAGTGNSFGIWPVANYESDLVTRLRGRMADRGPRHNPMTRINAMVAQ